MSLPFFFEENLADTPSFVLNEETSRHIIHVLRLQKGKKLQLTDGGGKVITAEIIHENKKATEVKCITASYIEPYPASISVAISLIKNSSRFEWFAEKATEIGISAIIPLLCERTEKQNFRLDRVKAILVSAMLQSQQAWLPSLSAPVMLKDFLTQLSPSQKYIAHCINEQKNDLTYYCQQQTGDSLILIGPEGDFTKGEVDAALQQNFIPVSLGTTRLRTETAGLVASVIMKAAKSST